MTGRQARIGGFTLIEVVVALAVASGVIATAVALQDTVMRAGRQLTSSDRDWTAAQFLRGQIADRARRDAFQPAVQVDTGSMTLVTRRSAQFGRNGPLVVAHYSFGPARRELRYREAPLPPWWADTPDLDRLRTEIAQGSQLPRQWSRDVFDNLDGGQFEIWDPDDAAWRSAARGGDTTPKALRLVLTELGGQREIVLDSGASSYFSFSGS